MSWRGRPKRSTRSADKRGTTPERLRVPKGVAVEAVHELTPRPAQVTSERAGS